MTTNNFDIFTYRTYINKCMPFLRMCYKCEIKPDENFIDDHFSQVRMPVSVRIFLIIYCFYFLAMISMKKNKDA